MSPEKAFGEVVRQYRKERGLSQEMLASASGLDRSFISHLERGVKGPTIATIFRVASALHVSVAELMAGVEMITFSERA